MRETTTWSLSLGRWGGVEFRLHASFLICAVLTVFFCSRTGIPEVVEYSVLGLAILLASVLLHEFGHSLAAFRLGGRVERVTIAPFGSFSLPSVPEPQYEAAVALAGPAVNFLVMILVAPPLVMAEVDLRELLLSPLHPQHLFDGDAWLVALKLTCWINALLLLNLFPAFPLDGGHALCAVLRPVFGSRPAVMIVGASAMLAALGLMLMALFLPEDSRAIPSWLPLTLFAIFLFFQGKHQIESWRPAEREEEVMGYDFSEGYTSLERSFDERTATQEPGLLTRWIAKRREERRQRLAALEAEEERRVDEVLARLNEVGMDALSPSERALLNRVSKRYRERQRG